MSTFGQVGADRLEVPYRPPTGAERREVLEQMRAAASPGAPPARTTPQLFLLAPLAAVAALAAWALGGSPLSVLLGCWLGVAGVFVVGRSVATVAEICFAVQWAIVLYKLGMMTGAQTSVNASFAIVPLILIAECFSWYAVLTRNYLHNAIENSLWAVSFFTIGIGLCRLLLEFDGAVYAALMVAIVGIAGYLAFLMTIDVPMYLGRWRREGADGHQRLTPLEGLRDVSTRWVVTRDHAAWKGEIAWMSLYFSAAVWASLALCVFASAERDLPRYRTPAAIAGAPSDASAASISIRELSAR